MLLEFCSLMFSVRYFIKLISALKSTGYGSADYFTVKLRGNKDIISSMTESVALHGNQYSLMGIVEKRKKGQLLPETRPLLIIPEVSLESIILWETKKSLPELS